MALVDQYGFPIQKLIHASESRGPRPYWQTKLEDTKKAVRETDWRTLVSSSRKLWANFGVVKGATVQKAMHAIGRAWEPVFTGTDKAWGDKATAWLREWFKVCDVRGPSFDFKTGLFLDSIAVDRDGDFFILLTEFEGGFPAIQHLPAHCIGQRGAEERVASGPYRGYRITHGVIYNDQQRPIAYRILGDKPEEDRDESAANVIHRFDPEWHDQMRGFPAFSHAINDIRDCMQSGEWEQHAMLIASTIGLIEHNEAGGVDPNDPGAVLGDVQAANQQFSQQTLEGGMIRYFRAGSGSKLESFRPDRPGDMWEKFNDRIIRNALLGAGWPYSLCWKPDGMNGTQERSEIEKARASILDRQDLIMPVAQRVVGYAIAKAAKLGLLPMSPEWYQWTFTLPPKFSIDNGRDGQSRREDYKLGHRNLRDILGEQGLDYDQHTAQRDRETEHLLDRAKRISEEKEVPFGLVLSLLQQQTATASIGGGVFGTPLNDPENPDGTAPPPIDTPTQGNE